MKEKLLLENPTSANESAVIRLFKEGLFYVAYNESDVLFQKHFWSDMKVPRIFKRVG